MARKYKAFILAFLLSIAADQGTKIWARHTLQPKYPGVVSVIPGYFDLRYSENIGAAFGLLRGVPGARVLFFVVGIGALFIIYSYLRKAAPDAARLAAELGLVAGGAIGNIVDRAVFAKVTDFIVWKVGSHEWPTFNIADAALVVGVIGLLFDLKPEKGKDAKAVKAAKRT